MKNMKISKKLIVSFLIVIIMAIVVGFTGIFGMNRINSADRDLYNYNVIALDALGSIRENFASQRNITHDFALYDGKSEQFATAISSINSLEKNMEEYIIEYTPTMNLQIDKDLFNEFLDLYRNDYMKVKTELKEYGSQNNDIKIMDVLETTGAEVIKKIEDVLFKAYEYNVDAAKKAVDSNTSLYNWLTVLEIAILVATIVIAMSLAARIAVLISRPVRLMSQFLTRFATAGDIEMTEEDRVCFTKRGRDEIGACQEALGMVVGRLSNINDTLDKMAGGDLSVEMKLLSDKDNMGRSISTLIENLNGMFSEIRMSASQVSTGSKQIADGAQTLAQGSTEQASAVEELSVSIGNIAAQTNENAIIARQAADLSGNIKKNAEKGSSQMEHMMQAVREINDASASIGKVIEVIDNIAFQTNILALNASVEAARAGSAGKGFAVVAEEVRSLAEKSADAAKDTESLIENSIAKANFGLDIATETSASLNEIVEGINSSVRIVEKIAASSDEQAGAIAQINTGIDQVAQVIQQNSATAEESAAASQEMSGQSEVLEQLTSQFILKNMRNRSLSATTTRTKRTLISEKTEQDDSFAGYGKY